MPHFKYSQTLVRVAKFSRWSNEGVLLAYDRNADTIGVKFYSHCSCYDTEEAVRTDNVPTYDDNHKLAKSWKDINWDWLGSSEAFFQIAKDKRDMKIPKRTVRSDDYDSRYVLPLYEFYVDWFDRKQPRWEGKRHAIKVKRRG